MVFSLDHEGAENLAKAKAEELGIKLGDFMMPIRMAVTGSRVSPPLIGSIVVLYPRPEGRGYLKCRPSGENRLSDVNTIQKKLLLAFRGFATTPNGVDALATS